MSAKGNFTDMFNYVTMQYMGIMETNKTITIKKNLKRRGMI